VPFDVPVTSPLQEAIDAMATSDPLTFLVTAQDNPFSAAGFGNWVPRGPRRGWTSEALHFFPCRRRGVDPTRYRRRDMLRD
jgi:hypothetical protein